MFALSMMAPVAVLAADNEFGSNTPYYEDDGWLDVTEWFDGNDYNPTDEKFGRWDDEVYQAAKDTGTDVDSDWYGYSTVDDNDWFYDYYDTPYSSSYSSGYYPYGSSYYDYNYDGYYDAQASYYDSDGDGIYDRYDYYTFTDSSKPDQQKKMKDEAPKSSKEQTLSGKILKIKEVQTKGGKHTVVQVQQADETAVADLGKVKDLQSLNLKEGDQISVMGLMSKVGEKTVVMARSIDAAGKQMEISRERNKITGKIVDSRKVKIRGIEHQMAMVDVPSRGKVAVDLGAADKFKMDISKGKELIFSGLPVKVKGKALMMAQSVHRDEKTVQITRSEMKDAQKAGSKQ
jgi:hypothetical protein